MLRGYETVATRTLSILKNSQKPNIRIFGVFEKLFMCSHLITAVSTVILSITDKSTVDTPAVRAVVGPLRAGRDPAHEGHQGLAGSQLPLLPPVTVTATCQHAPDTLALHHVGLFQGPVAVVLADLVPRVCRQRVGLQLIVGLEKEKVLLLMFTDSQDFKV